jgi:hypothetical protein
MVGPMRLLLLILLAIGLSGCSDSGGGGDDGGDEPTDEGNDQGPMPGGYNLTVDGEVLLLCPTCLAYASEATPVNLCASLGSGEASANGFDCHYTAIAAEAAGLNLAFESGDGAITAVLTDGCAPDAGVLAFVDGQATPYSMEVPAGTACVVVFEVDGMVPKSFSYTIA